MTRRPGRPPKYLNADQLFANCARDGDCFIWPTPPTMPSAVLGPDSVLARMFHTTGVARILFSICRFFPAGNRVVRWCNTKHCVNPYHHAEAKFYAKRRLKMENPNGLLPEQEKHRHLLGPSDEEIAAMKPTDPEVLTILTQSAARAGFYGDGLPDHRHKDAFKKKEWSPPPGAPVAKEGVPVLVVKGFNDAPHEAAPAKLSDEAWDELEGGFAPVQSLPEIHDETRDVEHPQPEVDIFETIRRRQEWERTKK